MCQRKQRGFTIIELMLAMSFVSVLLVSVAMLTIQIGHLYNRGITMKEINQAGTEITDDVRRSIADSYLEGVEIKTINRKTLVCTGIYTYLANDAEAIEDGAATLLKYANNDVVRLAKIRDTDKALCRSSSLILPAGAVELLSGGNRSLVVREMELIPATLSDGGRMLYTFNLTLSGGGEEGISDDNTQCRPPNDVKSSAEYCAIDTFSVIARVGNTYKN
jgi:prepilin-type N-terminal cleavage/methylation domain-containing protein